MHENVIATLYNLYLSEEPLTTTELAKKVFDPEETDEVRNADRKIRHYVDTYAHLFEEVEASPRSFTVDEEQVFFGVGKMHVRTRPDEEVVVGFGHVMVYQAEDGTPEVVDLTLAEDESVVD